MVKLPSYVFKDLGPDGGRFDDTSHPKLGWHSMETMSIGAAESAFKRYPPHLGVVPPWPGYEHRTAKHQYVSLDRHAYAFAGSEADDEYVIQVEVAGFARSMRDASDDVLEWLAANVVIPLEEYVGIPRNVVRFGFHDTGRLAYADSAIRLTLAELREFSGHLGHQHMPGYTDDRKRDKDHEADKHWDPGALDVPRILGHARAISGNDQEDISIVDKATQDYFNMQFAALRTHVDERIDEIANSVAGYATIDGERADGGPGHPAKKLSFIGEIGTSPAIGKKR